MNHAVMILILLVALIVWLRWRRLHNYWGPRPRGPRNQPPRHRVRWLRLRLHLRLRPARGLATGFELWWHWSRWASYRESKRTRPSLTRWERVCGPAGHSLFLGRAHHFRSVRVPVQEHGAVIGPPRSGKSALMSRLIMAAPGPVVSTSSKPDMFTLTSGIRTRRGPVWVFNPQGIGGIPSNVRWSPISGCEVPEVAIRRGLAFAAAISTEGAEESAFWRREAGEGLQGLFAAAALSGQDMRTVGRWVGAPHTTPEAAAILAAAGQQEWSDKIAELNGPAEKTAQTIRTVMSSALSFLRDPALAEAVLPTAGEEFSIDHFLLTGGTLYLIAKGDGEDCAIAPLFAAIASEIQYRATQIASLMPGGRLDPPLLMALDELTQICPVPLPAWLADSGGQGVSIWTAFHGYAQLRARWKDPGAQTVLDTSNVKVVMPGLADADTLGHLSKLCGQFGRGRTRSDDGISWHDVLTMDMIRRLPAGFSLLIRGGCSPVIVAIAKGWRYRPYRALRRRGLATLAFPSQNQSEANPSIDSIAMPELAGVAAASEWTPSDAAVNSNAYESDGTAWWADS